MQKGRNDGTERRDESLFSPEVQDAVAQHRRGPRQVVGRQEPQMREHPHCGYASGTTGCAL